MSSLKKDFDGWGWLWLIPVLVALAATKPDEEAHRAAIAQRTPVTHAIVTLVELVDAGGLEYHDYFFFSVMTAKSSKTGPEMPVSIGVLGKVYYGKEK